MFRHDIERRVVAACIILNLVGCGGDDSSSISSPATGTTGNDMRTLDGTAIPAGGITTSSARGSSNRSCISNMPANGWKSPDGLIYQLSAVDSQIVRVRIGAGTLPEDASWAVPKSARVPLTCMSNIDDSRKGPLILKTANLNVVLDTASGKVTVTDREANILSEDVQAPSFRNGGGFTLSQNIPAGSAFYGLGDKVGPINRRGGQFINWNHDSYRYSNDPVSSNSLYRSIPFFIRSSQGVYTGVFLDNTWKATFDFGKKSSNTLKMSADGGGVDYYIISGDSPKEVIKNYTKLTGTPPLPPLWAFGYQQSRYSYDTASQAVSIVNGFRSRNIPADVLWLDIGFQDKNYPFTSNSTYKPFDVFVKKMDQQEFKTVVIADMHIAQQADGSYAPYNTGHVGNYFIKRANGHSDYTGKVWPTDVESVFPDFTSEASRKWWGTLFRDFYVSDGVAGFWNDMNEPAIFNVISKTMPDDNVHRIDGSGFVSRPTSHLEVHNILGMQNSRGTYEGMLALKSNQRPFVMTRASYAGGQRYAATWTGDNVSSWEHLRMATNQITGLGLGGFAYAAADIPGYSGTPSSQLLTRWLQVGAFYPLMRGHKEQGNPHAEPWEILGTDPDVNDLAIRTKYIRERYALLPYIYTIAEESSRTGIPMMRRMYLEFPNPRGTSIPDIDNLAETQFMLGASLLIAPSPALEDRDITKDYDVILPQGEWYDYWTGKKIKSLNESSKETWRYEVSAPSLRDIPVFVRAGSIIPRLPAEKATTLRSTRSIRDLDQLELAVYPGKQCSGSIYMDSGDNFDYLKGRYYRRNFTCIKSGNQISVVLSAVEGEFVPSWKTIKLQVYGVDVEPTILGAGAKASIQESNAVGIVIPENRAENTTTIVLAS